MKTARRARGSPTPVDAEQRRRSTSRCRPTSRSCARCSTLDLYDQALDELRYAQKDVGRFARDPGDDRLDPQPARRPARRHQRDEARLSAVPRRRRREAADRAAARCCSRSNYWDADPPLLGGARARSVPGRGADRAGVDLHRRRQVVGERLRPDAAAAVDRPPVRATARHAARFSLQHADDGGVEHQDGHRVLRRSGASSSAARTTRSRPTTPAPNRVARWIAERPGLDRDEFIDDIPFPETQNYVKRILGTAEDYRRLYGSGALRADEIDATPAVSRRAGAPPKPAKASASPAKQEGGAGEEEAADCPTKAARRS